MEKCDEKEEREGGNQQQQDTIHTHTHNTRLTLSQLLATLGLQFRLFNVSGTGTISRAEAATLAATLNANGFPVGSPEYFVETIDSDRSGSISFKEYLEYMLARLNGLSAGPGS
eukprot:m.174788 g.174788  ORF g.174788 m.174788 type:complete len:114 (+) comp15325_c4_seq8:61-402(+)